MKRLSAGGIVVVLVVAGAESLLAHHSLARFDTTTAVRVKGVISDVAWINPHSIVYVDEKRQMERFNDGRQRVLRDRNSIGEGSARMSSEWAMRSRSAAIP